MDEFKYQIIDTQKDGMVIAAFFEREDRDDFWEAYDEMYGTEGLAIQDKR